MTLSPFEEMFRPRATIANFHPRAGKRGDKFYNLSTRARAAADFFSGPGLSRLRRRARAASVHLLVESLEAFEVVGLANALVRADALEARDAQRVTGAVARGLLYVLKVNLDDGFRLDLNVAASGRDDVRFETGGQFAQGIL